jgi:hypothetical protein
MCRRTWGEGFSTFQFFELKKVENLKKTGSVTKSGKVNAGMECRELSFSPVGSLFLAESRLVRAMAEPKREQAAEPTYQIQANTRFLEYQIFRFVLG